jgi:transcriptional regulator with XRE-family HTH domain
LNERSDSIYKLQSDFNTRAAYIHSKVSTLVPSQIKGLRLKSDMPRQKDLAQAAELHQSRISMFETPGANPTVETLSAIAAALRVGLKIEFVPFSEMLAWENGFSQDRFDVTKIDEDQAFLNPAIAEQAQPVARLATQSPVSVNAESYWKAFGAELRVLSAGITPLRYVYVTEVERNATIKANDTLPDSSLLMGNWGGVGKGYEAMSGQTKTLAYVGPSQQTNTTPVPLKKNPGFDVTIVPPTVERERARA